VVVRCAVAPRTPRRSANPDARSVRCAGGAPAGETGPVGTDSKPQEGPLPTPSGPAILRAPPAGDDP
jgi:hypothetical protein